MADLRVSAEAVTSTASSVQDAAQALQGEFDRICAAFDEVVGASWTGQAADGLKKDWTQWREGFADVMAGLHREADALHTAAQQYTAADHHGASSLSQEMRL